MNLLCYLFLLFTFWAVYLYDSLNLVAVPTVWILIKIVTQLLILNRWLFWRSRCLCVFASEKSPWTVVQRKFLMGARENEFHISQNYIFHIKFTEIYLCFHISCEIWPFIFSDSHEKFSLVLLQMTNYIFRPYEMEKRMQYSGSYSGKRFLSTEN